MPRATAPGIGEKAGRRGFLMNAENASAIGARAWMIRRRRGLSLEIVAGLAGISKLTRTRTAVTSAVCK
jgi:phage gp46-like protein